MKKEAKKITSYKKLAKKIIRESCTDENLRKINQIIDEKDRFTKEYSRGGLTSPRGYYNPSLLQELLISNQTRGKLLKKVTKTSKPDYCYYFDETRLVLIQDALSEEARFQSFQLVYRVNDIEYTVEVDDDRFSGVIKSTYIDGKILSNVFVWPVNDDDYLDLTLEEYCYNENGRLISAVMTMVSICPFLFTEDVFHLEFLYDLEGHLVKCIVNGDEDEDDPVRIPAVIKELITGETAIPRKKLLKKDLLLKIKEIVSDWKDKGIYAISIFIDHDGDEVTDFTIDYSLEENQEGEERWNYACWDQDEVSLMQLIGDKDIQWEELLILVSKLIRNLQEDHFFYNLFHQEIAVLIHGYEETEEELNATKLANPNGQADEFLHYIKGLGKY